jgi:DNA methylase
MTEIALSAIVWDSRIYPRAKWSTATIERYTEAIEAGDRFPALVLEQGTNRLLDGKHRLEAYKRAEVSTVPAEWHTVPDGVSAKRYAAMLSARHGDRMSNADLKALALEECEADPKGFDVKAFMKDMGIAQRTVYDWVGHILSKEREERQAKVLRLSMLGWTQQEIAERLEVARTTVTADVKNCESAKADIQRLATGHTERHEIARRFNLQPALVEAITIDGLSDEQRMRKLGIKTQPYDVWQFPGCHDLMGDNHPGRIPGELVTHVLYFYTEPGDLVVDPMAGSGTTLDACLLMGRKARSYDIDLHHERIDVETHDLRSGWPETTAKARLVFWDPPYFAKMDAEYVNGSISGLKSAEYLEFFAKRFTELRETVQPGTVLAFLMSDYDDSGPGIFLWDYADLLRDAGWHLTRQIQCPLSTQQVHPDIVNKFRESRRLARLERYLLIGEA